MSSRSILILGAVSAFFSVALGAFGAHALKTVIDEAALRVFHTGVEYQFYHSLALLAVGVLAEISPDKWIRRAGTAFAVGIPIFAGSLYILAVSGVKWWGAVTPFGGVSFMLGWLFLLKGVSQRQPR
jgi:uncharacterized membrane protein YgdD (TMEM256/DUF423 family)